MPCADNGEAAYLDLLDERKRRGLDMPCADYPPPTQEMIDDKVVPPAALCAILRAVHPDRHYILLDNVDWERAGITRYQFDSWWARHQVIDRKRREREQAEAQQRALREQALAKLTPEERKALDL